MRKRKDKTQRFPDEREGWYFVRLAFLAIPWKSKDDEDPVGTLVERSYLIQATSMKSAFKKADHILAISEHCEGDGRLRGKRVVFKRVGILDLVALYEHLQSGVELYEEAEADVRRSDVAKRIISVRSSSRMIALEGRLGRPDLLNVWWGDDFDKC
ncbi:MAG: hypothetical protein BGO12_11295 [Verrucomicrobia bacterium 61-8]|nr:MAG: hypothetical protein BGO12_11295 [Verrucomicrobia bacterium 61-8]